MMSIDDNANFNTIGLLTNSGGVQFTHGMQVIGGSSISYDSNTSLNIDSMGTHITGPFECHSDKYNMFKVSSSRTNK